MTQTQGDRVEEKCSLIWKKENFNALIAHSVCWMFVGGSRGVGAGRGGARGAELRVVTSEWRPPPTPVLRAQEYPRQDGTSKPLHPPAAV